MRLNEIRKRISAGLPESADAQYESKRILCYLYNIDETQLSLKLTDDFEDMPFESEILLRRKSGEPLEYILGKTVFCGLDFEVNSDCLIPQSDTEVVVDEALGCIDESSSFIDLGTGSGCIAVCLAKGSCADGTAVDISEKALKTAKRNASLNGVEDNIEFIHADILNDDSFWNGKQYDLIVSNPPYIRSGVIPSLSEEVNHEPLIALDGGENGLMFYENLIPRLKNHLKPNGHAVFEIGYDQADSVCSIFEKNGFYCKVILDYGGNERCISARVG